MPPTIILVHGASAESASWDGVIEPLRDPGQPVIAAANPRRGVPGDAAALSDLVRTVDGPVVLAAHSYGGTVTSNVDADAGEIVGLVYANGFARSPVRTAASSRACSRAACSARGAAGVAQRRNDRPLHRFGQLPRPILPGRPGAAGRTHGRNTAPRHPGGARRTVRRPSAVKGRAVMVPDRRAGPHHPRRAPALDGRARRRPPHHRDPGRIARVTVSQPEAAAQLILDAAAMPVAA
jgi:pimeloyl-ACP methyl ester carboxylesterase